MTDEPDGPAATAEAEESATDELASLGDLSRLELIDTIIAMLMSDRRSALAAGNTSGAISATAKIAELLEKRFAEPDERPIVGGPIIIVAIPPALFFRTDMPLPPPMDLKPGEQVTAVRAAEHYREFLMEAPESPYPEPAVPVEVETEARSGACSSRKPSNNRARGEGAHVQRAPATH
jgi:hypothetical protein